MLFLRGHCGSILPNRMFINLFAVKWLEHYLPSDKRLDEKVIVKWSIIVKGACSVYEAFQV